MDVRGKLAREARKRGFDSVTDLVSAALSEAPSIQGAAASIGVAPNAIQNFLNREGLAVIVERRARIVRADSMMPLSEGE